LNSAKTPLYQGLGSVGDGSSGLLTKIAEAKLPGTKNGPL
jgi:hypothetical protein